MNIKKLTGIMLLAVLGATSCTDLGEEPFDVAPAETYYQSKDAVIAAVLRPYEHGHWCGWDGDRWLLSEVTADNFVWTQKGKHGYDGGDWVRLQGHTWTPEDGHVNGGWVGPYQGIAQCNAIIKDISALDYKKLGLAETDQAQHVAELRTLRAWFYLFLIDYF